MPQVETSGSSTNCICIVIAPRSSAWGEGKAWHTLPKIHSDFEFLQSSSEFPAPLHSLMYCLEGFVLKALFAAAFSCECDLWCSPCLLGSIWRCLAAGAVCCPSPSSCLVTSLTRHRCFAKFIRNMYECYRSKKFQLKNSPNTNKSKSCIFENKFESNVSNNAFFSCVTACLPPTLQ